MVFLAFARFTFSHSLTQPMTFPHGEVLASHFTSGNGISCICAIRRLSLPDTAPQLVQIGAFFAPTLFVCLAVL
jgi:hypothetical protein